MSRNTPGHEGRRRSGACPWRLWPATPGPRAEALARAKGRQELPQWTARQCRRDHQPSPVAESQLEERSRRRPLLGNDAHRHERGNLRRADPPLPVPEPRLRHSRLPRERRRRLPARSPPRHQFRHLPPLRLALAHRHLRTAELLAPRPRREGRGSPDVYPRDERGEEKAEGLGDASDQRCSRRRTDPAPPSESVSPCQAWRSARDLSSRARCNSPSQMVVARRPESSRATTGRERATLALPSRRANQGTPGTEVHRPRDCRTPYSRRRGKADLPSR